MDIRSHKACIVWYAECPGWKWKHVHPHQHTDQLSPSLKQTSTRDKECLCFLNKLESTEKPSPVLSISSLSASPKARETKGIWITMNFMCNDCKCIKVEMYLWQKINLHCMPSPADIVSEMALKRTAHPKMILCWKCPHLRPSKM